MKHPGCYIRNRDVIRVNFFLHKIRFDRLQENVKYPNLISSFKHIRNWKWFNTVCVLDQIKSRNKNGWTCFIFRLILQFQGISKHLFRFVWFYPLLSLMGINLEWNIHQISELFKIFQKLFSLTTLFWWLGNIFKTLVAESLCL